MTVTPRRLSGALAALLVLCLALAAIDSRAAVLYDETFPGLATDLLNGTGPDVDNNGGFNLWAAHSGYRADGATPTTSVARGAWLPFVPTNGNTYTLTTRFSGVGPDGTSNTWFAMGFSKLVPTNPEGGTNRFVEGDTTGRAWMIFRPNNPNPTSQNQYFVGNATSGTTSAVNWPAGPIEGGDVDMQIVLSTAGGAGTFNAMFFAKRPEEASYTQLSASPVTLLAEDIGAVGFARNTGTLEGRAERFTLETTGSIVVPGDVTGDGFATIADFNVIRDNLFNSVTMRSQGDLNSDGIVNFVDFRQWKLAAGTASPANTSIPEPSSLTLLLMGGVAAWRRRSSARNAV
jgi:hypothetical protein